MTKEEKIKEAYGEHWETVKEFVDNNGYCDKSRLFKFTNLRYSDFETSFIHTTDNNMLPKSLQGIETNNGWVKIESEADLPKDWEKIYYVFANGEVKTYNWNPGQVQAGWNYDEITHYQPIQKPKPPIY